MPLEVELVAADHRVWSGEASMVVARTLDGDLGVLPGHSPVLAVLAASDITIKALEGGDVVAHCDGGFLSVEHDRVMIVSDRADLGTAHTVGS
ncbi:MAG: F0F1 ATP synthase subunit epsilon [Kineosporiaceae bacterium]|nr:F0F1 ATP synthase subunit epsilon [Kineosporiaceae bacterium]MBK8078353.1 F0F1 ATP synthase subunit epsilon [Kineosporiaceae bacterium]